MPVNARELLIKNRTLGVDALVDKILSTEPSPEKSCFDQVKALNASSLKRQYIESSLLTGASTQEISTLLEIPLDQIEMYRDIYYNVTGMDKLSKMELLDISDKQEASLKIWAMSQGLTFIAWRLGKQVQVNPVDGLADLFTTCLYKSKEAMFNANVTTASIESTKWVKLSIDIARLIKLWTMDASAARRDIEMAIQEAVPEFKGFAGLDGLQNE